MRTSGTIERMMRELLPTGGKCAQRAAAVLLRAMMIGFTAVLMTLARQAELETSAKVRRQYFSRWLDRPNWAPETLYAGLNRKARRLLAHRKHVPLLVDITDLGTQWGAVGGGADGEKGEGGERMEPGEPGDVSRGGV